MQANSRALEAIRRSSARAFLVGADTDSNGRTTATIHMAKSVSDRKELSALRQDLLATGEFGRVKTRRYSDRKLMKARSVEKLIAPMAHDKAIFDATGAFERGRMLTDLARDLRAALGEKLVGVYWNARWRTLFVRLDDTKFIRDAKLRIEDLARTEDKAKSAMKAAFDEDFCPALRLGFELPEIDLVAVDEASLPRTGSSLAAFRNYARVPAIGMAIGLGTITAAAAEDSAPAVSDLNGKLAVMGGYSDTDTQNEDLAGIVAGSLTTPLGHSFGFQADGAIGSDDGDFISGVGGHLFWRDPSQALVGAIASFSRKDVSGGNDLEAIRLGAETEIYLDQFTVAARAGEQFGHNVDDGFFGSVNVSWYATDDFRLRAGVSNDPIIDTTVDGDLEYRPGYEAIPGLAYFADTSFGDDSYVRAAIGVRFYFGDPGKSLKERHRLDDPEDNLGLAGLNSITGQDDDYVAPYFGPV